jgi:hypothetical protein
MYAANIIIAAKRKNAEPAKSAMMSALILSKRNVQN